MNHVKSFVDPECSANAVAGGKGANLGLMTRAGLPVPPGFVIATSAYREFVAGSGISEGMFRIVDALDYGNAEALEVETAKIRAMIESAPVPQLIRDEILQSHAALGRDVHVAVRSSGTAEDMSGASFAGLHDTYLDVLGGDSVVDAVRRCWASMWSARATSYRHTQGFEHRDVSIAVVVQRMVESEVSGVMFTANPLEGRTTEFVVNANWGLGESIVSGHVDPDEFVIDADQLQLRKARTGAKEFKIVRDAARGAGTTRAEIQEQDRSRPCLSEPQLTELSLLGRKILAWYEGVPQDIEWALADGRFYVLQSRPVTGVDFQWEECIEDAAKNLPGSDDIVWTLRWAEAYWTGGISPLHYSVRGRHYRKSLDYMVDLVGFPELKGAPYFRYHRGTVYYNTGFHNEFAASVIPTFARAPYLELVPDSWRAESIKRPLDFPRFLRMLLSVNSSAAHSIFSWKKTQRHWIDERVAEATAQSDETLLRMSAVALKRYAFQLEELMREYCDSLWMGYNVLFPNIFGLFGLMVDKWYKGDNRLIVQDLISGNPTQTQQSRETHALFALAQEIRADSRLLQAFRASEGRAFFASLEGFDEGRAFLQKYQAFIAEHGHRGAAERDIYYRRRADDSGIDYEAIRSYLNSETSTHPETIEKRVAEQREKATREVIECLQSQPFGDTLVNVFRLLHQWVLDFLCIRDDSRHYADRITYAKRKLYMEMARRCVEQGRLEHAEDCFFLTDVELYELLDGAGSLALARAKIAGRRKAFLKVDARRAGLPLYMRGDVPVDFDRPAETGEGRHKGIGLSGGLVRGRARVVPDLKLINRVEKGDILICNATDPGWAPVFTLIQGLVIETGGMLAHGACLSREHGIPAVQLRHAMQIIPDGARVEIRGESGEISVVE